MCSLFLCLHDSLCDSQSDLLIYLESRSDQVTLIWLSTDHHKSTDSNFSFCLFCQSANDGHISALWSLA